MLAAVTVAAASCTERGDVERTGPDTYLVTENYSRGLFDDARNRAVIKAGEYCYRTYRRPLVQQVSQGSTTGHGAGSAKVTFRCLYRGDPELRRES